MDKANIIVLKLLILILCDFLAVNSQNNNYGLCSDLQCSEPIAMGVTIFKYVGDTASKLTFTENQEVTIYVTGYGEKKHLIGVTLNGKKGYIPKSFVKETKTLRRDLVPAQIEFISSDLKVSSYYVTSHIPTSVHPHHNDMHHTIQPSVPNNLNPPLESSREEQHHSHSSNQYLVNNDVHSNYFHEYENVPHAASPMYASHMHPGFEASMSPSYAGAQSSQSEYHSQNQFSSYHSQPSFDQGASSRGQNFEYLSNVLVNDFPGAMSESNKIANDGGQFMDIESNVLLPSPTQHVSSNQMPAQVNGEKQNFISQSDTGFYSQGLQTNTPQQSIEGQNVNLQTSPYQGSQFNPHSQVPPNAENFNFQSNAPHQQSPVASPQVTAETFSGQEGQHFVATNNPNLHTQVFQSILPHEGTLKQEDSNHEYDETMAMLEKRGLNTEGELSETYSSKNPSIEPSSSFQSTNVVHHVPSTNKILVSDSMVLPGQNNSGVDNNLNFQSDSSVNKSVPEDNAKSASTENFNNHTHAEEQISSINDDSGPQTVHTLENTEEINAEDDNEDEEEEYDDDDDMFSLSEEEKNSQEINIEQPSAVTSKQVIEQNTKPSVESTTKLSIQQNSVDAQSELKPSVKNSQLEESIVIPIKKESLFQHPHLDTKSSAKENFPGETKQTSEDSRLEKDSAIGTLEREDLKQPVSDKTEEKSTPFDILKDSFANKSSLQENKSNLLSNEDIKRESVVDLVSENNDFSFQENETSSPDIHSRNQLNENKDPETEYDSLLSTNHNFDSNNLSNASDVNETESETLLSNAYQTRHLKDVDNTNDNISPAEEAEQIIYTEFNLYTSLQNSFEAIRYFIGALLPWIPDPLYTLIIDLEKDGISPKVPVFTALSAVPCIILIVLLVCIKEKSKEKKLIAQLTVLEKNHYNLTAEKSILEEKMEKMEIELQISRTALEEQKISSFKLKTEIENLKQQLEDTTVELEKSVDTVDTLKEREREYMELVRDHEKEHLNLLEQKAEVENALAKEETTVANLTEDLQKKEAEVEKLLSENSEYCQANEVYEEKLTQLQKNCNQLLKEAEIWNARVNELNEKLNREVSTRGELENTMAEKDNEIKALSEAVQIFKSFEEVGNEEEDKTNEGKLQYLINSSSILIKLQNKEEENKFLSEKLEEEKNKLLEMEVSILDVKSENDKLKINYNQALQDKAEAQTKLEVLTNYFKDKEIQLQRQLGVQEAVRQKTEEDASSAERRICLIEQENTSYKYQVATMKQEMEETERNLKNQIAVQEKKAHENWLAARTAERKLEDVKQEVMQLRQRLTLLEREQENWTNSQREEIVRPVPKRVNNDNDNTITSQDINNSMELRPNMYPPPPMMLPLDRPLPPLPPPIPPFPPFEPPPFRPQPWHMPPPPLDSLSNSDYRVTPTEFTRGRESTPPRGRSSALNDGDMGPRQSSPLGDMRDSRNSTPPHFLPDFHDIPPHPPRPFFPPMGPHARFPLHPPPPFRKEMIPGQRRIDNQDESNSSYGSQRPSVPQDNWHNPNSRV